MPIAVGFDMTHARLNRTGLGRYASELAPALQRRGDLRMIELSAARGPAATAPGRIARGLAREGAYYPVGFARTAARAGAHVLHTPTPAAARGGGLPLVVTVHDLLPLRMPELFTRETRLHTRLYMPFVRRATRVITPSLQSRCEVVERLGIAEERVSAIAHGCAPRYSPREVDRDRMQKELGIAGPYVLAVGTLEPRKNLATVLRVFARVSGEAPEAELVIVGARGWQFEAFEAALGQGPAARRVRTPGFVSEQQLVELYAGAACFLYPSLGEGFGLPPLEAMACGAPVVVSDRPALPEVTGDAALRAGAEDDDALAAHVIALMRDADLAAQMRAAGIERARSFTWEAAAAATSAVYHEALAVGA